MTTVQEAQLKKALMEAEIKAAIRKFEAETGMRVTSVAAMSHHREVKKGDFVHLTVECEIKVDL